MEQINQQKSEFNKKYESLEKDKIDVQNQLNTQFQESKRKLDEQNNEIIKQNKQLQVEITKLTNQINNQKIEYQESLQQKIMSFENEKSQFNQKFTSLEKEKIETTKQVSQIEVVKIKLEEQYNKQLSQNEQLKENIKKLTSQINTNQREYEESQRKDLEFKKVNNSLEEKIKSLIEEKSLILSEKDSTQKQLIKKQQSIENEKNDISNQLTKQKSQMEEENRKSELQYKELQSENKTLQDEINKLRIQIEKVNSESLKKNSQLNKENSCLQEEINSLKQQKSVILEESEEILKQQQQLQKINDEKCQEIEELVKKNKYLSEQKSQIINESEALLQQLKQQHQELQLKHTEAENQIQNMQNLIENLELKYQQLQSTYEETLNEIKNLKAVEVNLRKNILVLEQKLKGQNKFVEKKDESQYGYDMIIQMSSLYDLLNTLLNKVQEIPKEDNQENNQNNQLQKPNKISGLKVQKYNKEFNSFLENVIVIGLQGQRNKGKTFLLNCLINQDFPSDFHLSTPGVCIKKHQIKNNKVVYVDSEGLGNPVIIDFEKNKHYNTFIDQKRRNKIVDEISFNNLNKDITNKHFDIKATEQIQQEFIIQNSNILLIAISQVTLEDQKLIHTISEKFIVDSNKKDQKHIIVVHNLKDLHRPEYVKEYMQNLKKIFPVQEKEVLDYFEQQGEEHNNIFLFDELRPHIKHVIMAYKESEAGKQYNQFALYYIKKLISLYQDFSTFDIREKLQEYLNKNLKQFVDIIEQSDEQTDVQTDESKQILNSNQILEYSEENEVILLKKGLTFGKLKELQVNIFGSLYRDCSYSIVKSRENKDQKLFLFVEIPGSAKFLKKLDNEGMFHIIITQNSDLEKDVGDEIEKTTRKFEEKPIMIKIGKEKERWKYIKNEDVDFKNGVVRFAFKKKEDPQFTS